MAYTDLMIRDYFGDNGSPRSGNLSQSPDIIPAGTTQIPNYQTYLTTGDVPNQDIGQNIVGYQTNYLYVRCLNQASGAASGQVYLYYAQSNLLMAPGLWSQNQLNTMNGAGYGNVSATAQGQYTVGDSPFIWVPQPPTPGTHYCMVARVSTTANPNPIPTNVATYNDFVNYIANTPGAAWRNVVFVGTPPDWSKTTAMTGLATEAQLYFQVQCTGVPVGSQVGFSSDSAGPDPAINLQPTTISTAPNFSAGMWSTVPANWSGNITVNWWSNGQANWAPGASIILKSFYTPPSSVFLPDSLRSHFRDAREFDIYEKAFASASAGPTPIFNVGSMTHQ